MRSLARQAGAVFEHELRHARGCAARASAHGFGRARGRRRRRRRGGGEREEDLPRHHVVRQLVDVADDVPERRRIERRERRGAAPARRRSPSRRRSGRRPRGNTCRTCRARTSAGRAATPTSRARRRPPDSGPRTRLPRACAASMNVAPSVARQSPQGPAPSVGGAPTAIAASGGSTVSSARRRSGAGREANLHRLEIDEQRVRSDVVGLERLAVERGRIVRDGREERAVEHEVAVDARQPLVAQHRHERLPSLDRDLRIAAALEHEIAVQHAGVERAVEIRDGPPAVVGAEQFERGERRDELHHRRGVVRPIRLVREQRPALGHVLHDDGDGIERHARVEERAALGTRQLGGAAAASASDEHASASAQRSCALDDLERARDEQRELVVGQDVGRHEVDGAADRPQQQPAREALPRSTSARNRRGPCRLRTPRSCRDGGNCAPSGCAASGAASSRPARAFARLAASTSSSRKMSSTASAARQASGLPV